MNAAILPVKRLDRAKGRLAPHFAGPQRMAIAGALVEDAMHLALRTDFVTWWVVSDDDGVLHTAERRGLGVVRDRGEGLNQALEQAISVTVAAGAASATVVPSDLPLAWPSDIEDLVDTGSISDVVVAPSRDGGGTNALGLRPPDLFTPRFGPHSLQAHVDESSRLGVRCSILQLRGLSLDIDTIQDVDEFLSLDPPPEGRTVEVLSELRAATR